MWNVKFQKSVTVCILCLSLCLVYYEYLNIQTLTFEKKQHHQQVLISKLELKQERDEQDVKNEEEHVEEEASDVKDTMPIKTTPTADIDHASVDQKKHQTHSYNSNQHGVRYLLPIKPLEGGGANAQYNQFMGSITLALLTGRTLVMTPFFNHGGHEYGHSVEHMRNFNLTFDVNNFSKLLPLATIEEFNKHCNRENMKVIAWTQTEQYDATRKMIFSLLFGIELPSANKVIHLDMMDIDDFESQTSEVQCLAHYKTGNVGINMNKTFKHKVNDDIHRYLTRAPAVVDVVDALSDVLCDGEPYLALHWRNRSTERRCALATYQAPECSSIITLLAELADKTGQGILKVMNQHQLKCVYIACPLWSLDIVKYVSKYIPRDRIFVSGDLKYEKQAKRTYFADHYLLSLVEQEIAYRAAIFVRANVSNWSDFVEVERRLEEKITYNIRELPGMPSDIADREIV